VKKSTQRAFVDTNILVYAADNSARVDQKTQIARELLLQNNLWLSVQVLNEFTVNARHRQKLNLTAKEEYEWLQYWLLFPIREMTVESYLYVRSFYEQHLEYTEHKSRKQG
jgi:predicted nucleic acid-binding protein